MIMFQPDSGLTRSYSLSNEISCHLDKDTVSSVGGFGQVRKNESTYNRNSQHLCSCCLYLLIFIRHGADVVPQSIQIL